MIEYVETKKHKILALILNFILVFGLIWIPTPDTLRLPTFLSNLDFYLTIAFALPLLIQLKNIFKKTYLQFGPEGIKENISLNREQYLRWEETEGIRFIKVFFVTYLLVDLKEPRNWFKDKNWLQKIKGKANYNRSRTPVHIPIRSLNVEPRKIIEDLNKLLQGRGSS